MVQGISLNQINKTQKLQHSNNMSVPVNSCEPTAFCANLKSVNFSNVNAINSVNTTLSASDKEKYTYLLNYLKDVPVSLNSEKMSCKAQLDKLLKNGKLLAKSTNDNTTTLDNLYLIATTPRVEGIDSKKLISNALDILVNPRSVTQTFGDIPKEEKQQILSEAPKDSKVSRNPELMNVETSGTCAAASNEVNLADKFPAEFARWLNGLSSPQKAVYLNIDLTALSKNKLDAITILNLLKAQTQGFSFDKVKIKVSPDDNAYIRAKIQNDHWDKGERNVADVLIQSAVMQLGSQNTYDSLTDTREGDFNSNPQGLIELEKTFVESLITNKETTSLVYQKIDENQNLVGYNCSFDKIEKHITQTIDSGNDVIMGYVLTNETSGRVASGYYDSKVDGAPNKVINGHEITIVDYYKDDKGKTVFICIDTDDDSSEFVQYTSDWLLPKIHHAGYPDKIVEADEKEIMKNLI